LNKKVIIINAVLQEIKSQYHSLLRKVNLICIRETLPFEYARQIGMNSFLYFDEIMSEFTLNEDNKKKRFVISLLTF
tara:strand:- start:153 stop:383 length:231 start_codon:yes stop_codon:yes gene_type:complete